MNPLRALTRDLFERRLWPLVALLALAVIAIPVLFLHSPQSDATSAPIVPDVTGGGPTTVPSTLSALLAGTGAERVAETRGVLKDPFLGPAAPAPGAETAAVTTPAGGGSQAGQSGGASTASTGTAPTQTGATAPVPPAATTARYTIYRTDVRYGAVSGGPVLHDLARLTALPSAQSPVAIFLGVLAGGRGAIFEIRSDARPVGSAACRPTSAVCTWVVLKPGGHVDLQVPQGSSLVKQRLSILRISPTSTSSPAAAKRAYERSSAAGRCLLGPLAAYHYDPATGTLEQRSEVSGCQYTVTSPSAATH